MFNISIISMKTRKLFILFSFLIMGMFIVMLTACKKEEEEDTKGPVPVLTTADVSNITAKSAGCGGNIINDGGKTVTSRGMCWSTGITPTVADKKTNDGSGAGIFFSTITGLQPNTTYFARAYATNSNGTGYGSTMSFTTQPGVIDIDGNVYNIVTIGTQTWMTENLRTTRFRNGNNIPHVTDNSAWSSLSTPAYCWNNNDSSAYAHIYGALYNWYAVSAGNLCPEGWHVPTDGQWTTLTNYLGGENVAGGKMKEAGTEHWNSPNTGATNESGFTALPGGARSTDGSYGAHGEFAFFWSATQSFGAMAYYRLLRFNQSNADRFEYNKRYGLSVRCLKD